MGNLESVTLDDVRAAARQYLKPSRAGYLLVGDRAGIEAQLSEKGLATAEILDTEAL